MTITHPNVIPSWMCAKKESRRANWKWNTLAGLQSQFGNRLGTPPSLVLAWRPNHALKLFLQNTRFFRIHTPQECTPLPPGSGFHTIGCQIHLFEKTMTVQSKQITVIAEAAQTASDFQLNALIVVGLLTVRKNLQHNPTVKTWPHRNQTGPNNDSVFQSSSLPVFHVTSNNIAVPKSASL